MRWSALIPYAALLLLAGACVGTGGADGSDVARPAHGPMRPAVLGWKIEGAGATCRLLDPAGRPVYRGDQEACRRRMVSELKKKHGTGKANLPFVTLGGKQLWSDLYYCGGWRIQRSVLTGHHRLLDAQDTRRAWGSFAACRTAFAEEQLARGIRNRSTEAVVFLHGLLRSKDSFAKLHGAVAAAGYESISLNYPSTRRSIAEHAEQLSSVLDRLEGVTRISFVTHSLGGIVVRQLLAARRPWQERIALGRVVMLAPPNQGSLAAETFKDWAPFKWVTGASGQGLTPDAVRHLPAPPCEFGIIAGGTGDDRGLNPLLPGDNDGTVLVKNTRLQGAREHKVIKAMHSFIMKDEGAIAATLRFLRNGHF